MEFSVINFQSDNDIVVARIFFCGEQFSKVFKKIIYFKIWNFEEICENFQKIS